MTKVICFFSKENRIKKVVIRGHSEFSYDGNDIVCAAISSVCEGTLGFIRKKYNFSCSIKRKKGFVSFFSLDDNYDVQLCLEMLIHQLENISYFYPSNLSLERNFE